MKIIRLVVLTTPLLVYLPALAQTNPPAFMFKVGIEPTTAGYFAGPRGIALDTNGYVYVADTFNNRIQKFTPEGAFLTEWGSAGDGPGQFNYPSGVAVDNRG